jgi:hypothetical protein
VATLACEALLEGQAQELTAKCIQMALGGDTVAMRLCLERLCPPRRDRPVSFSLPPIDSPRDAADISAAVAAAVSNGDLTPGEAVEIGKVVDNYIKAYQTAELDERVARVEQLTDAELNRIACGEQRAPKLLLLKPQ